MSESGHLRRIEAREVAVPSAPDQGEQGNTALGQNLPTGSVLVRLNGEIIRAGVNYHF
jgi:hypothetical protein